MEIRLQELRKKYIDAKRNNDISLMEDIILEAEKIKTAKCYFCKATPATLDGYYCSQACKDKYYPPNKNRPSINEMQQRLLEIAKRQHIKEAPSQGKDGD